MSFTTRRLRDERPRRGLPWKKMAQKAGALVRTAPTPEIDEEKRRIADERAARRISILKRVLVVLFGVLVVTALLSAAAKALVSLQVFSIRNIVFSVAADLPKDEYGHTNVLLLGTGDKDHDGVDLTDSMMIASIDPATKSAVMLSIPRDLWILQEGGRVNTLYRDFKSRIRSERQITPKEASPDALRESGKLLGELMGVQIHGVIKADFSGFVKAVDEIGGVDLDVPYEIIDREYPGALPDTYQTFRISKGPHHLDGETALKYARSRHTTSDFSRSERQQQLLRALAEKARSEGLLTSPTTILSLWNILGEHVETTFEAREVIGLVQLGMELDGNVLSVQLHASSGQPGGFLYPPPREEFGGASVLLPSGGQNGWKQIQTFVHLIMGVRTLHLARANIRVVNADAVTGSARRLGDDLVRYGFTVTDVDNAPGGRDAPDLEQSFIVSNAPEEVTDFFVGLLKMPLRDKTLEQIAAEAQAQAQVSSGAALSADGESSIDELLNRNTVTITLGQDYDYVPLSTLLAPPAPEDE